MNNYIDETATFTYRKETIRPIAHFAG